MNITYYYVNRIMSSRVVHPGLNTLIVLLCRISVFSSEHIQCEGSELGTAETVNDRVYGT